MAGISFPLLLISLQLVRLAQGECSSIPDALMKGQWLDRYDGALTWVAEYSKGLYMQKVAGADTIVTAAFSCRCSQPGPDDAVILLLENEKMYCMRAILAPENAPSLLVQWKTASSTVTLAQQCIGEWGPLAKWQVRYPLVDHGYTCPFGSSKGSMSYQTVVSASALHDGTRCAGDPGSTLDVTASGTLKINTCVHLNSFETPLYGVTLNCLGHVNGGSVGSPSNENILLLSYPDSQRTLFYCARYTVEAKGNVIHLSLDARPKDNIICDLSATSRTSTAGYIAYTLRREMPCVRNPCLNGGLCMLTGVADEYKCICPKSYVGVHCHHNITPQEAITPTNNSTLIIVLVTIFGGLIFAGIAIAIVICQRRLNTQESKLPVNPDDLPNQTSSMQAWHPDYKKDYGMEAYSDPMWSNEEKLLD